ncbi:peptidylprolyl isomerase [Flexithrix dorotheae]|uniref:peptidylprolyl isomerase n=1 Tax=Flexithrix dorotheae TaxID=70993 RepID=UPI00035DC2A4|nr:peptidylprolyl isomerase [Flexithrix dorotheae]
MKNILFFLLTISVLFYSGSVKAQKRKKPPKKSQIAKIATNYGSIHLILFDDTPKHRDNFSSLAKEQYYDSTKFHRVLVDFMIQGGDPNTRPGNEGKVGSGGPGYLIDAEILDKYVHDKGMLAAARQGDFMNPERKSSGSQFYIVQNNEGAHHLDGKYTIFGEVIKGIDIVDEIANQEVGKKGVPVEDIWMKVSVVTLKRKKITQIYNYQFR